MQMPTTFMVKLKPEFFPSRKKAALQRLQSGFSNDLREGLTCSHRLLKILGNRAEEALSR